VLEKFEFPFSVVFQQDLETGEIRQNFDVLVFVDDGAVNPIVPQLSRFLDEGGTVLAIGDSTELAYRLGLPVANVLADGKGAKLDRREFYVPGSVLQAKVDNTHPLAYGMPDRADFFFDDSPSFRVAPDGDRAGLKTVAWYDSSAPLRSGWAWGQRHLEGSAAVVEAPVGEGRLFLFGPEVLFRSQPHGTYKLFFNGLYYGHARLVSLD
jgi:hypothetical protein